MRGKVIQLLTTVAASVYACAMVPQPARAHGDVVSMNEFMPGTIVVRTNERRLYYVTGIGTAIRYSVGVGRAGKQWSGTSFISGKYIRPSWSPPAAVRRDKPYLPKMIASGSSGKYRHTGLDKRGSDINGARKLAGLNANHADGALATNDAVRRYFDERFVVSAGRGSTSKPSTCRRLTLSARPFRQES
jgi:lipoprotein-anchoring transpeptidase ErfK/SrfK